MKKFSLLICICLLLSLSGCFFKIPPPSLNKVNKVFSEHVIDIKTVVEYIREAEYDQAFISDSNKIMHVYSYYWSDIHFKEKDISDIEIQDAIQRLFDQEIVQFIMKTGSQVEITIWSRKEVSCYIVCTSNGIAPSVEYATEIMPMEEDGWYYVIADYNEWRIQQREAGVTRPGIVNAE